MKQTMKRGLALIMALLICIGLLPAIQLTADATNVDYVYSGNYIYNWGTRGEPATYLSQNAEAFYTGDYTYENLYGLEGSSDVSTVPSSALYVQLKALMAGKQTHTTSYDATRNLFQYTDCQNSGGKISSFYSGAEIGPTWDSGSTWNREHTWPDSKGDASGQGENDIMMLRPTSTSENSSRGNDAYGESSGYYNPNSESNGAYDLRGDVSRIMLFVYVRWGNTGSMWGSSGVMESKEVLLRWMEEDPVDTWELGRNDSVESITGTRNVFVDYPELAFRMFGEEVPEGYVSPTSGNTSSGHQHIFSGVVTDPTCTAKGYTTFTCTDPDCGYSYVSSYTAVAPHDYVDGVCTVCGAIEPVVDASYLAKFDFPKHPTGSGHQDGSEMNESNATYTSGAYTLKFTNYSKVYYNAQDLNGNGCLKFGTSSAVGTVTFEVPENVDYVVLYLTGYKAKTGGYSINQGAGTKLTKFSDDSEYDEVKVDTSTVKKITISTISGSERMMMYSVLFYGSDSSCEHDYEAEITPPTCVEDGYTTYTCKLCGNTYTDDVTEATGHTYVNGKCKDCGQAATNWTKVDLEDITASDTIAITMTKDGTTWALYNANGTSAAPKAIEVTVVGNNMVYEEVDTISWNIVSDSTGLIIYKAGSQSAWLYSTSTNNGTRVGTNTNKYWEVDAATGYLKHQATSRYLGVYNSQDWRSYTNTTGNTAGQTLSFWKLNTGCTHSFENGGPTCDHCTEPNPAYAFVDAAEELTAALGDETKTEIVLEGDIQVDGSITVSAAQTLDLNGYDLTAANLVAFGSVIDSSDGKAGLYISGETKLQNTNPQLPVFDSQNGCYRLFTYAYHFLGEKEQGNAIKYGATIKFTNLDAYQLIANGGCKLTVTFALQVSGHGAYLMEYSEEFLKSWAENAYVYYSNPENTKNWAMTMCVTGIDTLPEGTTVTMVPELAADMLVGSISSTSAS